MAKNVYWDGINGDNGNDGLTVSTPKRTLAGALAAAAGGDIILMEGGVYPASVLGGVGATANINKSVIIQPRGRAKVIWDFENIYPNSAYHADLQTSGATLSGVYMRNPNTSSYLIRGNASPTFIRDCVFYQRDGGAGTGSGAFSVLDNYLRLESCSFYNLNRGEDNSRVTACYFKDCNINTTAGGVKTYNAYPGNGEATGYNTSVDPDPGFVDAAGEDFRLNITTVPEATIYRAGGLSGGPVGASGAAGPWWDSRWIETRFMSPDPTPGTGMPGSWVNDPNYQDPGGPSFTGTIIEDPANFELIVDLITTPAALSGAVLSPVFDFGADSVVMGDVSLARFDDLPGGSVIDTDTALPQKYQHRQSATSFNQTDGPGVLAWTDFDFLDPLSTTLRYQQVRVIFQVAHTGV